MLRLSSQCLSARASARARQRPGLARPHDRQQTRHQCEMYVGTSTREERLCNLRVSRGVERTAIRPQPSVHLQITNAPVVPTADCRVDHRVRRRCGRDHAADPLIEPHVADLPVLHGGIHRLRRPPTSLPPKLSLPIGVALRVDKVGRRRNTRGVAGPVGPAKHCND